MAPSAVKQMPVKAPPRVIDDSDHLELAQQFKTISDYTSYVLSRIQLVNPELGQAHKPTVTPVQDIIEPPPSQAPPVMPPPSASETITPVEETIIVPVIDAVVDETEDEPRPRKEKRIKGRRRAANPDIEIEAAMRRQAELKTSFRTLARPLKQVLDEMARRTTEALEGDANTYKTASEHEIVEAQLRQALEKRKADVQRQFELQQEQLKKRFEAEQWTLRKQCERSFEHAQSRMMDQAAYEMLQIDRQHRLAEGMVDHETEDEDDVIPQPHHMSYRYNRGDAIEPAFDSRSRHDLEVAQAHQYYDDRIGLRGILDGERVRPVEEGFTVMDTAVRDAALARRQAKEGLGMLVTASQQIEGESRKRKRKTAAVVANKDAVALMELASMAAKTSGRGEMGPPVTPRRRYSQANYPEENAQHFYDGRHGHKRTRSDLELSSPASKRAHLDHMSPANLKKEHSVTPGSRLYQLGEEVPPDTYAAPFDHGQHKRLDYAPPYDRAVFHDDRRMSNGMLGEMPPPPLGPPFGHPQGIPPYPERDYRPDFSHRPMLHPPPMPPTAAPVNHFANGNIHRHSFPSAQYPPGPPISSWTSMTASPLVALPQGDAPPVNASQPPPFIGRHPYNAFPPPPPPPHHHMGGPPPHLPNQYGGPTLAPAGLYRAPQPAFAQQADRQEQTKRRNTESNVEKRFKAYQPPTAR